MVNNIINFIKYTIIRKLRKQPHKIRIKIVDNCDISYNTFIDYFEIIICYNNLQKPITNLKQVFTPHASRNTTYRTNLRLDKWCEI